jgi:dynein heavy chain
MLDEIVNLVRSDLPPLVRMTLGSLIVVDVHAKDVIEAIIEEGVTSKEDFSWISQLRYYINADDK